MTSGSELKNGKEVRPCRQHDHGRGDRRGQILQRADLPHPSAAGKKACAVVLPRECRACLPEGIHDVVHKDFQIESSRRSCHDLCAEAVDGRLDDDIRQAEDSALHAGRRTDGKDLAENPQSTFISWKEMWIALFVFFMR